MTPTAKPSPTTPEPRRPGRPSGPPAARLSHKLNLRLTESDFLTLTTAAARSQQTLSDYVRGVALKAAGAGAKKKPRG